MPRRKQPRRADVKDIRSILRLTHESELSVREVCNRCTDPTWDVERLQCTVRVLAKAHWSWMKEMIWGIIRQVSARA